MKGFRESEQKHKRLELKGTLGEFSITFDEDLPSEFRVAEGVWASNGGTSRSHPSRSLPFTLECSLLDIEGVPKRIELIGAFARFADSKLEPPGTMGASVQILDDDAVVFRQDLVQGRHYSDASNLTCNDRANGDGTSLKSCGLLRMDGVDYRLDRLTIDLPELVDPRALVFRDLGTPASFVILGVYVDVEYPKGCPFHSKSGLISLREVGAIVRVGDRRRFSRALAQLDAGILSAEDLDEARGQALTFLAVVTAGMLESGGAKELHRIQLDAARTLDKLESLEAISECVTALCEQVAEPLFAAPESPSGHLVDRALAIVDRNFAKQLTDSVVAEQLGLSTSHFRFLFKQATGNPFHKYLIAVRLEKAKQMLLEQGLPVSHVAAAVGFTGLSHFSRAFAQRFKASPTSIRRQAV